MQKIFGIILAKEYFGKTELLTRASNCKNQISIFCEIWAKDPVKYRVALNFGFFFLYFLRAKRTDCIRETFVPDVLEEIIRSAHSKILIFVVKQIFEGLLSYLMALQYWVYFLKFCILKYCLIIIYFLLKLIIWKPIVDWSQDKGTLVEDIEGWLTLVGAIDDLILKILDVSLCVNQSFKSQ